MHNEQLDFVKLFKYFYKRLVIFMIINSDESDEVSRNAMSDLGLHSLQMPDFGHKAQTG